MFLSRLILNPASRRVRSELGWPYEMHRTLMRGFSHVVVPEGKNAREETGVLFRADVDDRTGCVAVYVQSLVEPDWSFLSTFPGYLISDPACKDITKAYGSLREGQALTFRLRANPSKRIAKGAKGDDPLKGKRVGLLREEEQIHWLIRKGREREKGKPGGFEVLFRRIGDERGEIVEVPRVRVQREGNQKGRKREQGRSHTTTHLAVRFDGLLRITDADAFRETLSRGVGAAKAFGFGLLSVAAGPSPCRFGRGLGERKECS